MRVEETKDRALIRRLLEQDPELHIYELGDLDPFFWPRTRWFVSRSADGVPSAVCLLYRNPDSVTLVALDRREPSPLPNLLAGLDDHLPDVFYAHLSPGGAESLGSRFRVRDRVPAIKMALVDARAIESASIAAREPATARQPRVDRLAPSDRSAVESFYAAAYPKNWFDPSMLETGCYFGIRDPGTIRDTPSSGSSHTPSSGGSHTPSSGSSHAPPSGGSDSEDDDSPAPAAPLVCVAGVHVFSPTYHVAALGNIATHPSFRRRGFGARVTAELCRHLATRVKTIGLNVHADNAAAIACYRKLGFEEIARFEEVTLARRD